MKEKYLNVRVAEKDVAEMQRLVEEGHFMNVSDAVRTAIRRLIDLYNNGKEKKPEEVDA